MVQADHVCGGGKKASRLSKIKKIRLKKIAIKLKMLNARRKHQRKVVGTRMRKLSKTMTKLQKMISLLKKRRQMIMKMRNKAKKKK